MRVPAPGPWRRAPRTVPLFLVVDPGAAVAIIIAFVMSYAVLQNCLAGVQGAWFSELFATHTRTTGTSLVYQMSAVVSGFTRLLSTALYAGYGRIRPALLFSGYGVLGLVAAVLTRETWSRVERERLPCSSAPSPPKPLSRAPRARVGAEPGHGRPTDHGWDRALRDR